VRDPGLLVTLALGLTLGVAQPAAAEILPSADVAVSLSDNRSPDPVVAGGYQGLTYSITVRNNGTVSAQAVTVGDALPSHTTFVSFSQTSGPPFTLDAPPPGAGGTVTAMTTALSAGASASFELTILVDADTAEGTRVVNTARASSQTFDPVAANDSATMTTRVTTYVGFAIEVIGLPAVVLRGNNLSYTLSVQNWGPSDAQAVVVTDLIPGGTTFVSFTQNSGPSSVLTTLPDGSTRPTAVSAAIATLPARAKATFTLVLSVDPDTSDGTFLYNTAFVNSATRCAYDATVRCGTLGWVAPTYPPHHQSYTAINIVSAHSADLAVGLTDTPDPVGPGSEVTYLISLVNYGPDPATGIWLHAKTPQRTTLVSWTQTYGPAFNLDYCCTRTASGQLASGETATFTLVVRVNNDAAPGELIENDATVESAWTSDPAQANNTAGATTEVAAGSP
jgi:uncharacterized repeat protein (TIGR01451 family)